MAVKRIMVITEMITLTQGCDTIDKESVLHRALLRLLRSGYTDGEMDYVRSSSDMQGYSLAGYATWMADNGMFLDTVVRMSKFDNDMTVDGSMKGQMDSLAIGVSAEGRWRVDLSSMFYVEPQAEVVYTYINSDDFTLGEARYEVEGLDSLTGRLGFASGTSARTTRVTSTSARPSCTSSWVTAGSRARLPAARASSRSTARTLGLNTASAPTST